MEKIPTIFIRDEQNRQLVSSEVNPSCKWVFRGEGLATQKYDGTCVKIDGGRYYKRREVKKNKPEPKGFILEQEDMITGKKVGWVPIVFDAKEDVWHVAAFKNNLPDGTYELIGPKINGNKEGVSRHQLVSHKDARVFENVPRNYNGLLDFLSKHDIEGIVFHHKDGRMAKIKKRDFGLPW